MRKAQPDVELAELIAEPIDLGVNAQAVERPTLQLEVQALAISHEPGIFPAPLTPEAVTHPALDARKQKIELIKFGAKLAKIGPALIATVISPALFNGLRGRSNHRQTRHRYRCDQNKFFHDRELDANPRSAFKSRPRFPVTFPRRPRGT